MKLQINKETFLDGLSRVLPVVSARSTLPVLSNLLLEANENTLRISATDLDMAVSVTVDCETTTPGSTTLPARRLHSIIKELPTSLVDFSLEGNQASIKSGPSYFRILGLPASDFPALPTFDSGKEITLSQQLLRDGLKKTSYAISMDETRYVLNGISANFQKGLMTLVATDGKRLAMVEQDLEIPESMESSVIIPTKAVNELPRLLGNEGEVVVHINASQAAFELNRSILITKLIDGTYPNYRQVIPAETRYRVALQREALLATVSRVALLAQDKTQSIRLQFHEDQLLLSAQAAEVGEAKETLDIKYSGPKLTISFNPEFLMAPLRNLDCDEVYIDLIDDMSPGVLRNAGDFLYVLMPMRTTN